MEHQHLGAKFTDENKDDFWIAPHHYTVACLKAPKPISTFITLDEAKALDSESGYTKERHADPCNQLFNLCRKAKQTAEKGWEGMCVKAPVQDAASVREFVQNLGSSRTQRQQEREQVHAEKAMEEETALKAQHQEELRRLEANVDQATAKLAAANARKRQVKWKSTKQSINLFKQSRCSRCDATVYW